MKQPEDAATLDWVGPAVETGKPDRRFEGPPSGRGRKAGQRCGPYQGAWKIGSDNMRFRIKTGKTQAEFAALCGISERTLRTWERGDPISNLTARAIAMAINAAGNRRAAEKYRDSYTGATWSGRGQKPAWVRARLDAGRSLAEFAVA